MEKTKGLFLCIYYNKDYSGTPSIHNMENFGSICYGENDDEIKKVEEVYENGKRGIKFIFIHGDYQDEKVMFPGDTATFYYSYIEITGPSDWDEVTHYRYLKLIEK